MNKKKLVAGVSIITAAMAISSPALGVFAAEAPVEITGNEWDGHPEISEVNRERARATFYPYASVEAAKTMDKENSEYYKLLNGTWKFNFSKLEENQLISRRLILMTVHGMILRFRATGMF